MLIDCSECGKKISDKAVTCPHCGAPLEKKTKLNLDILLGSVKCPACGSRNVMEINAITGMLLGGITGGGKRHRCNNCRHLF